MAGTSYVRFYFIHLYILTACLTKILIRSGSARADGASDELCGKFYPVCFDSDTPEVDIAGTNLYQRYVDRMSATRNQIDDSSDQDTGKDEIRHDTGLPACRIVPPTANFHRQTVDTVVPILVRTGVYRGPASYPNDRSSSESSLEDEEDSISDERDSQGHRDFQNNSTLRKPECIRDDVASAIDYILSREGFA